MSKEKPDHLSQSNIVLFGSAHAGKSTLAGYLFYRSETEEAKKRIAQTRDQIGIQYDDTQELAYIVDRSRDERVRTYSPGQGQSKRIHVEQFDLTYRIQGEEFSFPATVIDTPGAEASARHRLHGMSFGDIGVFCVEARDLHKTNIILEMMTVWFALKPNSALILTVTKIDMVDYEYEKISKFSKKIKNYFSENEVHVTPISISIENKNDINIFDSAMPARFDSFIETIHRSRHVAGKSGKLLNLSKKPYRLFSSV